VSLVTLVRLQPRRVADGVAESLRFQHGGRGAGRFLGEPWRPGIVELPSFEQDLAFDGERFGQGSTPQVGALKLGVGAAESWPALVWPGALAEFWSAPWPAGMTDPGDGAFTGPRRARVESIAVDDGVATLTLIDDSRDLSRPVTARRFGTTGTAALDGADLVDRKGQAVPVGWGRLFSVPGLLIDRADNVWLFLDRAATSVSAFYDGGAAFTLGVARASLAALKANVPAAGAVDYCLDAGGLTLARPWTQPTYPFTADLVAGATRAADIASAIVTARTSLAFASGTVAAFNSLYPADCGLYVDDERTIAAALDQLVAGLGACWRMDSANLLELRRLAPATPALTVAPHQLVSLARQRIVMPTRRRAVGWGRNNRVHGDGEIATILLAGEVAYQDGTPIEALKPAEIAADVTQVIDVARQVDIFCDAAGAALAGQLPRALKATRLKGDVDVSASTTWTVATQGCTATISSSGLVSLTAVSASGWIDVGSERDGVSRPARIVVTKLNAIPAVAGGAGSGSAYDSSIEPVGSTTYGTIHAGPLTVRAGAAGVVDLTAPLQFVVGAFAPEGSFGLFGQWEWRLSGGSWATVSAETGHSLAALATYDPIDMVYQETIGAIEVSATKSGLMPGSDYEFRLKLRADISTRTRNVYGTAGAVAQP
jgi:hypothetical protein